MDNLRKERLVSDKSQLRLMQETGIFFSTISRIDREWLRPSEEQKKRIAKVPNLTVKKQFPEPAEKGVYR